MFETTSSLASRSGTAAVLEPLSALAGVDRFVIDAERIDQILVLATAERLIHSSGQGLALAGWSR